MNVLLINPPWERRDDDSRARFKVISCLPSLGLGYIAACLEKEGINTKIIDFNVESVLFKNIKEFLLSTGGEPQFVGLTSAATTVGIATTIAGICKEAFPSCKTVLGGVQPTVMPDKVLAHSSVDYVVRGEGEYTLLDLIKGKPFAEIDGLSYKVDDKLIHNPDRSPIKDLDTLSFPAYHLFPIKQYHPPEAVFKRLPAINVITSRGCPYRCTYCATQTIWPGKVRFRSIENVLEELKFLTREYGIREISFSDDTLPAIRSRIVQLCEGIIKDKIDITWSCNAIVKFVDEDILRLMKAAGCHHICYGIESVDPVILKNINKNITVEDAEKAIRLTKKVGIMCRASFMFGNPGETTESMERTIEFAIRTNPDFAVFNITTPYPGTPIYNWAKNDGLLLSEDWTKYTGSTCLINLPTVNKDILELYFRKAWKSFYSRPSYIIGRVSKINSLHDVKAYFNAFVSLLRL